MTGRLSDGRLSDWGRAVSPTRAPMAPPDLPGYTHVRLIGSGGYSDVFLYEQQMPRRQVAIKVLLTEALGDQGRQQFFDEANAMASVSTHPFIVSVFHAELSASGHPYLVMEYYPRENFSVRARAEQIPVSEVLRVGVQVASAVETAHRAGILHRDIKPANILTSEYDRPGLTDFGIATASTGGAEAEGMSIPWSPPEVVNGSAPGDATADVYSLAATIFTLLSGRSPFEIPGGSNRTFDLIPRIESGGPQPTGRPDVPESLERLLRHGMSRSASDRPGSTLEFARMLQAVEVEQGWAATQLEISQDPRDVRARNAPEDDDGTRLKGPTVIQSQTDTGSGPPPMVTGAPGGSGPIAATPTGSTEEGTVARGAAPPGSGPGLVSGVGSRPVGLSGQAAPRPVAPMPSANADGSRSSDGSADQNVAAAEGPREAQPASDTPQKRKVNWLMLAAGIVIGVAVLVGLGFAFSGGDKCAPGSDDPDCEPTPDSAASTPVPPDLPVATPVNLTVVDNDEGTRTLRWEYPVEDSSGFEFTIQDSDDDKIDTVSVNAGTVTVAPAELIGPDGETQPGSELTYTLLTDDPCVHVVARRLEDQKPSDQSRSNC